MSGAMRKMGVYLGLLEDNERFEEYDDYESELEERTGATAAPPKQRERSGAGASSVTQLAERRRPVSAPREVELSRITTLHPRTYNEARTIGENFRDGIPVIMNLSEMDDSDAKRLVDFAAGLVFAVRGSIERVTSKVFLLSPPNVAVATADKARIADPSFFNQS
ncbi:MAG: cell division protein SepF [Nocardioidaceae bacterium]